MPTGADTSSMPTLGVTADLLGIEESVPGKVTLTQPRTTVVASKLLNNKGDEYDDFPLASCHASKEQQQFKFVGNQIQLAMDESMCLQAGCNNTPLNRKYWCVFKCNDSESLQHFSWDAPDCALTLLDFPDMAIIFRGMNAKVNSDPIILGDLNKGEVFTRKDWMILN